jgi:hypothetical protein
MWEHLLDFCVTWIAFGMPALACAAWLRDRTWWDRPLVLLGGMAGVCLAGYVAFWAWFANPDLGMAWTAVALAAAAGAIWARPRQVLATLRDEEVWIPLALTLLIGVFYIGLLHLYATPFKIDRLSASRYMLAMAIDNELPRRFAERLIFGISPKNLYDTWLSSDRPPLQVGLIVLNAPIARAIGAPLLIAVHAAGVWFQLLWVPATWALLRRLGFGVPQAAVLVVVTAITGLTIFHSIYLWPKLGGAALAVGAFVLYAQARPRGVPAMIGVAVLAGLAWLSHSGTMFSLLALGIMGLVWRPWPSLRALAAASLTFVLLAAPWTAYQKLYDPPGDRLVKWHIGGIDAVDTRGALEIIVGQYRTVGWAGAIANKKYSFRVLTGGWEEYAFALDRPRDRRIPEWYYFFRSFSVWNLVLLAAPIVLLRRKKPAGFSAAMTWATAIWIALTVIDWCLVIFGPPSWTIVPAGSLAANLSMFPLVYALAWRISPSFLAILAAISVVTSAITWIPSTQELNSFPISSAASAVAIVSALAIGGLITYCWRSHRATPQPEGLQSKGIST